MITTNNVIQFQMEWGGKQRECKVALQGNNDHKVYFDGVYLALLNIDPNTAQCNRKWGVPLDNGTLDTIVHQVRYPFELRNAG